MGYGTHHSTYNQENDSAQNHLCGAGQTLLIADNFNCRDADKKGDESDPEDDQNTTNQSDPLK